MVGGSPTTLETVSELSDEGECCDNADFLDGAEDDDLDGGGGDVMMEDDDTKSNTSSTFSTGTGFVNKKS